MCENAKQMFNIANTLVQHVIEKLQLEESQIEIDDSSATANGYLGVIFFVKVNHKKGTLNLVVKAGFQNENQRTVINIDQLFDREIYFYKEIVPAMNDFQKERFIRKPCVSVPKCYEAYLGKESEGLVLENLKAKGFKLWSRLIPMDEHHIALVLKEYGKFHAISFAMKNQNPVKYKKLTENYEVDSFNIFLQRVNALHHYKARFRVVSEVLRERRQPELADRVIKFTDNDLEPFMVNSANPDDLHSVILHGDCWTNNIMFRYEGINKSVPTEVRFVDFQISRIGSPILDFAYFFYTCSPKHTLDDLDKYLKIYHDSLSAFLKELGDDSEKLFPFTLLLEHWRKYSKFGLVMANILFIFMLLDEGESVAIAGEGFEEAFVVPFKNHEITNQRAIDVITHFADRNII